MRQNGVNQMFPHACLSIFPEDFSSSHGLSLVSCFLHAHIFQHVVIGSEPIPPYDFPRDQLERQNENPQGGIPFLGDGMAITA